MVSVPSVWVMPAPDVARLELMVTFPVTVVFLAVVLVLLARSRVPLLRVSVLAASPRAWLLPATSIPAESVVPPL